VNDPDVTRLGALPSASGGLTRLAYAKVKEAGIDTDHLLKKAGLSLEDVSDPGRRLRVQNQISFLNLAAEALKDDLLGFHLAEPYELREIGLLYYVSASSPTLADVVQRAARYSTIVNEGVCLKNLNDKEFGVTFRYVGVSRHLDRHQIEFFVTTLVRLCRRLTGLRVIPTRVRLTHRRNSVDCQFLEFFGDDVEFGAAADEVAFAEATKHTPVVSADPYLNKLLIAYCEEALSRRTKKSGSFQSTVENAIVPLLPHGNAGASEIARQLGLTRRTFARRLALEGTTFSQVLESLKSHLAERYLADDSLSISQIAWLLGYEEVSSFTHAFKRWTGKTPREARSQAGTSN
jgi:AraC-like DNA-binding protein